MRNFFSFLLGLLLALPAWAQQAGPVRLSWDVYATLPGRDAAATPRRVPSFRGAAHGATDAVGTYTLRLPGTVASGQLQDAVYEVFSEADARLLAGTTLPAAPAVRLRTGTEGRQPLSYVLVQPARRNPQTGQAERLVSFSYAYQPAGAAGPGRTARLTHAFAQNSVLSSGDWFKLGVPRSGIYKLDRATLQTLGLPVATLDPRRLQLFGNAVGVLPQANAAARPDDLVENNILFVGNADATFDAGEYFLFYARGPHTWRASQPGRAASTYPPGYYGLLGEGGRFKHIQNIYCDTAYYFVTVGTAAGRRVPAAPTPTAAPTGAAITTFLDRRFYEHDLVNLLHSGRRWLGEQFSTSTVLSRDFAFSSDGYPALTDLVPGDTARLTVAVAAASSQGSSFAVALGGAALGSQSQAELPICQAAAVATNSFRTYTTLLPASSPADPRVTLTFSSPDAAATGYLDYLELVVKRQLRLSADYLEFNSLNYLRGRNTAGTFTVAGAAGAQVWDVTDPRRPLLRALDSGGSFVAPTDSLREYVALQPGGTFGSPRLFGKVANQNLHNLNVSGTLDLVIVTHPLFVAAANRLAQHRRDYNNLNVAVVTTKQVFNEYSSGGQDVTAIRDLMKQVYDRNPSPTSRRLSLLLLGDASFDYKSSPQNDKSQEPAWWANRAPFKTTAEFDKANQNYVPTYESRESFLAVLCSRDNVEGENSYSSEDYYGLLDDSEGEWLEGAGYATFESTDIGIGRVPVRTPFGSFTDVSEANAVVDKLIAYDATASFGKWRNYLTLTADDDTGIFASESETIFAPTLQAAEPAYNLRKDYLDLFPQVSVSAGQRSPACVAAIDNALEQGSLLIGYTGHGGPSGLADEQIITKASLLALQNQNRLTFFVTGTCDLSTYDNPDYTSAGEAVLTDNLSAGAYGLFTTTRVVLSTFNTEVVNNFYAQVLARNAAGNLPTLGFAAGTAKNNSPSGDLNNRNYTLLADPTGRLAYPAQRVVLDSVNGHLVRSMTLSVDTLQALGKVRLSGHVENRGVLNPGFNGTATVTIFDKPQTVQTLGDQGAPILPVQVQNTIIYDGQATVRAGRWSTQLVVPKDITYSVANGRISLYAQDLANKVDAQGYQLLPVGGASRRALADTRPPRVHLFVATQGTPTDTSFVSGGVASANPLLIARLRDESGINTSNAGVGHDLTATLDNDPSKLVVVNNDYTTDVDTYRAGTVRYLYKDLAPGPHTIRLKAWDTFNNSTESTVDFIVASTEQLALSHVLNYPNPFSNITTFHFDQNRPGQPLDVQVQIFTVAGRLVKTLQASFPSGTAHVPSTLQDAQLTWDGRDDYHDQLARGVYIYRVSVRSEGQLASKFEKLVLLN